MRETIEDGIGYQWRPSRGVPRKVVRAVLTANGQPLVEGPWEETAEEAVYKLAVLLGKEVTLRRMAEGLRKTIVSQGSGAVSGGDFSSSIDKCPVCGGSTEYHDPSDHEAERGHEL